MLLDVNPGATEITRFADSAALLHGLLLRLGEEHMARGTVDAAVGELEQLLVANVERPAVLAACRQLLAVGGSPEAAFFQREDSRPVLH